MARLRGSKLGSFETYIELLKEGLTYKDSDPEMLVYYINGCIKHMEEEIERFRKLKHPNNDSNTKDSL